MPTPEIDDRHCDRCKYSAFNYGCLESKCLHCKLNLTSPVESEQHGLVSCKCLTVTDKYHCHYFEEL